MPCRGWGPLQTGDGEGQLEGQAAGVPRESPREETVAQRGNRGHLQRRRKASEENSWVQERGELGKGPGSHHQWERAAWDTHSP